jgi:hypothetical protein
MPQEPLLLSPVLLVPSPKKEHTSSFHGKEREAPTQFHARPRALLSPSPRPPAPRHIRSWGKREGGGEHPLFPPSPHSPLPNPREGSFPLWFSSPPYHPPIGGPLTSRGEREKQTKNFLRSTCRSPGRQATAALRGGGEKNMGSTLGPRRSGEDGWKGEGRWRRRMVGGLFFASV